MLRRRTNTARSKTAATSLLTVRPVLTGTGVRHRATEDSAKRRILDMLCPCQQRAATRRERAGPYQTERDSESPWASA